LFSTKGAQYAFVEMDQEGRRNIESFAAQHQSVINFMPVEGRVYFARFRSVRSAARLAVRSMSARTEKGYPADDRLLN
jgi:hypothetical protein